MSTDAPTVRSPWLTVWLSPRQTIERLVAARPTYSVWPLAILGTIASLYSQISVIDGAGYLLSWPLALSLLVFGALAGIVWLYLSGFMLSWIGRLFGGQASALHMRTVFAWSTLPTILGFVIILAIGASAGQGGALDSVPLLVAAFSLWSFVVFLLMLGRVQRFGLWRTVLTYLFNTILGLLAVLCVRSFLYQPFNIPSSSMKPTLVVGDYVFVSKFAYGYGRFSLPFSDRLPSGRIFAARPARGDVVVFRVPKDAVDYVKRVVGLPGDRIQMKQGELFINDVAVKREPLAAVVADDACGSTTRGTVKRWRETLPNGASYETLDCVDSSPLDNTNVHTVPDGDFFALGDNRDNSTDSRSSSLGYIPFENLIGRVSVIFFSRETGEAGAAARVRTERLGRVVR
ncbi:signal peptidase I [Bradyrhizobium sp.]|uniref:signal peptidase I n=1 Tax=Bradyrhizobium sp. TaxID=376 RepID=UPI003C428E46